MLLNKTKQRILLVFYFLFLFSAALITVISSPQILQFSVIIKLGQIFGVISLSLLVLQQIISARIPLLEKNIGYDRLTRFHQLNGEFIFLFMLFHPLGLFIQPILSGQFTIFELVKNFNLGLWLGFAAEMLIVAIVISAIFYKKLGFRYDQWRKVHTAAYLILLLGFLHSAMTGSDILLRHPLYYWWLFLLTLSVVALFYRYVVRLIKFRKSIYEVVKVEPNTKDVTNVYLKPAGVNKKLDFKPGQFAFIKISSIAVSKEEHPFTISASPTEDHLMFSIKSSGDFTSEIHNLKVGDKIHVEGPYGVFSTGESKGPFVFVAGGIGITPFRSMIRANADVGNKSEITLIYANKTPVDIAFAQELTQVEKSSDWLKVAHVLSDGVQEGAYKGFVSEEIIKAEVFDIQNSSFLVCGPPPMMAAVVKILKGLGVSSDRIYTEKFSLRG